MDRHEALTRLAGARVARLATVRPDGRPHVVPITFAIVGDNIVTAVDHKPKTTRDLQRLANIEANQFASVLADHYDEDWERLWWVRVDGPASIHHQGEIYEASIEALLDKYPQYTERAPDGPLIAVSQDSVVSWESTR
ncbi:MAG TPA: TIGR03668 family PPOX class F420-dependent oxidoreductase [Acidimicrobiia bacterium]|nr:TIGR03668 family PPOX class F420-dependent oxidoreductase [Acidimicrobiia bacterium]